MKDKIKSFVSKYKSLNQESKTLYFYGAIFVILLVFGLVLKLTGKLEHKKPETSNNDQEDVVETNSTDYEEIFNKISNNYEEDVVVYWYDSISYPNTDLNNSKKPLTGLYKKEFINVKKDEDKEIITYMDLINSKVEEELNDIDIIFIKPENILELMSSNSYKKDNKYMIETDNWIKLYNKLTNKNVERLVTGEIKITVLSYENDELKLSLDLTNLYKNLNHICTKVIYDINIYNINNIDLSDIE